ncbi:hypothetical protein C8J57DRAFT_1490077 [Mycena rebaudengoi]|nr:hypothetical protein C8J57DRAFT_1490077 [Mycena rebaudengoi]
MKLIALILLLALSHCACGVPQARRQKCRNVPGDASYPSAAAWTALNATVSGRVVVVVPSAKFCASLPGGACTDEQWTSSVFRNTIPGAMNLVNWEQGYDLSPPSLCLRNNVTACGQGDVPLYSVEAVTVFDIQAAVKFASAHNLRLVIKASGHDHLGRLTAPRSLLIHTANLHNFTHTDAFMMAKANGKIIVGGGAATVVAAGGFLQGAGHSALSPAFGLAADHALEFQIVIASGELLTVNSISHPDLFYALRGGGAGSWGVVVSATVRTFPTFNATYSLIQIVSSNNTALGELATLHARHIFDLDPVRGSQYFNIIRATADGHALFTSNMFMPNTTVAQGTALLAPFLSAARAIAGLTVIAESYENANINDLLTKPDDDAGAI